MKKKTLNKIIIILVIVALMICVGIFVVSNFTSFNFLNNETNPNVISTVKSILPAAEFISIHYYYTDVVSHSDSKKIFKLEKLPFTTKKIIYTIDGVIKLGINCKDIKISSSEDSIKLNMPKIKTQLSLHV